jgi:adenosylhomocysteine nucleosidase
VDRIAIFAALQWECRPVLRHLRQVRRERLADFILWRGATPACEVWVMKTGIGVQHAGAAARVVSDRTRFGLFVSTGCAGALTETLRPGDVTVATAVVSNPSGRAFHTDAGQHERACRAAAGAALRTTVGRVLCSPQMLASATAKRTAATEFDAVAVEMEGAAIATCAAERDIPFLSIRTILDTADTELPHAGRFVEPESGALKPLALAGYLATHPSAVPQLLAMQRMMNAAQKSLEQFFAAWFAEL